MKLIFGYEKGTKRYHYSKLLLKGWITLADLNKAVKKKFGFSSEHTLWAYIDELKKKGVKLKREVFYKIRKGW